MSLVLLSDVRRLLGLGLLVAASAACAGPPVLSPIEDEPMCADFELGAAKNPMQGSLRHPIEVRVMDGDRVAASVVLFGKRTKDQRPKVIQLLDVDDEYGVEWVQCENLRAPAPVEDISRKANVTPYKCSGGKVYKTEKLVTVKGDLASHTLKVPTPPDAECWSSTEVAGQEDDEGDEKKDDVEDESAKDDEKKDDAGAGGAGTDDSPDDASSAAPTASASAAPKAAPPPAKPPAPPKAPPKAPAPPKGATPGPPPPPGEDTYE